MVAYVRPSLPEQVFYDTAGALIDYGSRWRGRSPPDDSYSVVSHPERYAPLHVVADALIEYLNGRYRLTVREDRAFALEEMERLRGLEVARAIRVQPDSPDAAPLTFVFTAYPGVIVHAGLLHDFPFPDCGCDACDESLEPTVEEMEGVVLAVAAGGYSERVGRGILPGRPWRHYSLTTERGARAHSGELPPSVTPDERREFEERLRGLPRGWQAWPERPSR